MRHSSLIFYVFTFFILTCNSGCIKEAPLNLDLGDLHPEELNDGLMLSEPAIEGMDENRLRAAYELAHTDEDMWPIRSLLVLRHGKLVAEHYFKDKDDIVQPRLIWSATKQVTAILLGIALEEGLVHSLDDPISTYLSTELNGHPEKAGITLGDLLTMRSGIGFDNDGLGGETDQLLRQKPDNSVDFILNLPMIAEPGTFFNYNDGDPHLISAIIQKQVGKAMDQWADDMFFSKLGIDHLNWVRYRDGVTFGGFGIETTAREMAKMGLCIANEGLYDGQQVIPPSWLDQMLSVQVEADFDNMGYYWWLNKSRKIYSMNGHGGQYVYVVPDDDLVVVMTAIPNTQDDYQIQPHEAFRVVDMIIASCN